MIVNFYDEVEDSLLRFAVIAAYYQGAWVFVRHKERTTYELPGGHREEGESIRCSAQRELYEETGIHEAILHPVCVYSVIGKNRVNESGEESYGMLYYAQVSAIGKRPESEIGEVLLLDKDPEAWTYPDIQPLLLAKVKEWVRKEL